MRDARSNSMTNVHRRAVGIIVLMGPPGAGKGTQGVALSRMLGIPHISTGELLRENLAKGTDLGLAAQAAMEKGQLVPDALINAMLQNRLGAPDVARGCILDGFPRTFEQLEWLDNELRTGSQLPIMAIQIHVKQEELLRRISGRRYCPSCQAVVNVQVNSPKKEGLCDKDNTFLVKRFDDDEEVVKKRLLVYEALTAPVIECFRIRGWLAEVSGTGSFETVTHKIRSAVDRLRHFA